MTLSIQPLQQVHLFFTSLPLLLNLKKILSVNEQKQVWQPREREVAEVGDQVACLQKHKIKLA